ncbi:MAG: Smr/MutS family protein [Spirochaetaceae bacterium]|jgi:DNA-nicking Smr family endonuclease|nr:Smr/MutS family protein [Spirochaetaceae bacterium]
MGNKSMMQHWLDTYPPKKEVVQEKRKADIIVKPKSGLGHKSLEKLEAEITLDIHGLKSTDAKREVLDFIKLCYKKKIRRSLIIHGKGKHSEGNAVLKPMVMNILSSDARVACYGEARKNEGGWGASWFSPVIAPDK